MSIYRSLVSIPLCLILAAVLGQPALAAGNAIQDSRHHKFTLETVTSGLEHPWGLAFLPDGRLLVTERPGRLNLIDPRDGSRKQVRGVPEVAARRQGGLLDVALHPAFADNGWVYLSYSASHGRGLATHVGRGRLVDERLDGFEVIFRADPPLSSGQHFGSRLVFDRDGYLFVTVGDHGERESAQDRATHMGTVVRLNADGSVPGDNPFAGDANARAEIFSYGHRNPQGMTLHPQTGVVWLHEHGPRGGDEINIPKAGANFGWPKVTHGREYFGPRIGPAPPQPGFEPPLHHWTPSIAPSGMAFYDGDRFPRWRGDLFVGALAGQHVARVRFDDNHKVIEEERLIEDLGWRIRDVRSGPDGYLYLLPDRPDAALVRLVPAD
jgi:aldose sugar dehydrogenase